jgi:tetratricopeptide (TPR) repeat protein
MAGGGDSEIAAIDAPPSIPPAAVVAEAPVPPGPPVLAPLHLPDALPAYRRGDFIGDLFQVIETLGEGGFGIVYLARALASNEIVALKTLRGELLRDGKTRALFEKEARIWMDLGTHPNLVRAKWVDEVGGRLYIAMEYVQAGAGRPNSLEGHLAKGPIPADRALLWAIQFCRGMEYAVSKGVRCHRDIKPANILIGSDSVVRISDFGIAGLALVPEAPDRAGTASAASAAGPDSTKTAVGTVFGTPTHMAPEQFVDAASCDERSDLYSFGVVLYQMASGGALPFRPPPPPPALVAQAGAYYWHAFRILHTSVTETPLESPLASVVSRCLKKRREDRYQDFASLRVELEALYEKTRGEKAPQQTGGVADANDWNAKGMSLATLNRWAEALDCYDRALAIEPAAAALHSNRGNALRNLRRVDESLAAYDRAIALDPLYAAAWENKALLYAHAQRNQEALACIERSLTLDPTGANAWVTKGVLLGRLERAEEEFGAYESALRIDPRNVDAWFNKANMLSTVDRETALACADQALACDPGRVSAWGLKGTLLSELGRSSEAVACHQEARRLDPKDATLAYNLGNAWAGIERLEEARASYEDATRLAPDMPVAWYNLALIRFRLGHHAESIPLFDHFLSLGPREDGLRRTAERLSGELKAGRVPLLGKLSIGHRITPGAEASIDAQALPELREVTPVAPAAALEPSPPSSDPPGEPLPPPLPDLDALAAEAASHLDALRFEQALHVVENILKIDPREAKALHTRANALFKLGRLDEACAAIVPAIESSPGEPASRLTQVLIEQGAGRLKEAYRSAIDLIEIARASETEVMQVAPALRLSEDLRGKGVIPTARGYLGWLGLGYVSMLAGRTDAGLDYFGKAVDAAPQNIETLRWKASALKELGRADEALAVLDRALELSPDDPQIHHDRGIVLAMLREYARAVAAFDQALARDPNHVASLSDKGKYAGELGRYEVALAALRRAAALMPDHPAPWLNRALVEDLLKRDEDALSSFEKFLERARPEMRLQIESSKRRVEQLRARVAARKSTPILRPPAEVAPISPPADSSSGSVAAPPISRPTGNPVARKWAEQGRAHLASGKPLDALAAFDKAVERDPAEPLYWGERGGVLQALARDESARASWEKALALNPACVSALLGLAAAENSAGRVRESIVLLTRACGAEPGDARAWFALGEAHRHLSDWPNAYAAFAQCVRASPRDALAVAGLAEGALNVGRVDDALLALEVAIELDGGLVQAWSLRGAALSQKGRFAEAVEAQRRAVEIDPQNASAWSSLARDLHALKRYQEALEAADRALEIRPGLAFALNSKGLALEGMKRSEEALEAFDLALAADPSSLGALCNRGASLLSLKRYPDAFASFNRARELKADHKPAFDGCRAALAAIEGGIVASERAQRLRAGELVLPEVSVPVTAARFSQDECLKRAEMARNQALFDRALEFADQAIAADPRKYNAWMSKADALFGLKRYQDAAAHAKKAIELNPKFALAFVRLAASYDALNASEEALAAWEKTVQLAGQNVLNWSSRGQCLARMGRVEEALASYEKALAIDPRFSLGKFYKGEAEARLGRREDAITSLQQFLALAPPNLGPLISEARQRIQEMKA